MTPLSKIKADAELLKEAKLFIAAKRKAHFDNCDPDTILALVEACQTLEKIRDWKNEPGNHTSDCELRKILDDEFDDECTCTCGYLANQFFQIVINANRALKPFQQQQGGE